MENDRGEEILQRVNALEQKLDALTQRVARLEPAAQQIFKQPMPARTIPPVVQVPVQRRDYFADPKQQPPYFPPTASTASPQAEPEPKKDLEYVIGAQILPKAAALMTILGIIFGVIYAFKNGYITPTMMFGLEVAFCLAFIVTGIFKRDMKEEFGQILTGIGSCGLYAVFAGGHLYYQLFNGETLVGLFFALSIANLAFSLWRSSKAFLVVGMIGGLITAAVLPNLQGEHSIVNTWIHFLILIPTAFIIAKNKWMPLSLLLWLAATLALIPVLSGSFAWPEKVGILYISTALCLSAFAWSYKDEVEGWYTIPSIILWITGLLGLALAHDQSGAWQYLGFFAIFGGLSVAFWNNEKARNALLIGAIGVPITVGPFCFPLADATLILASLSLAAGLFGWYKLPKVLAITAFVELALAGLAHVSIFEHLTWQRESLHLVIFIAAVIVTGRILVKGYGQNESWSIAVMALCIPLFARLATVLLGQPEIGYRSELSIAIVLVAFCYYALALYLRTRWVSALASFWAIYFLALTAYVGAAIWMTVPTDVGLLIPMILAPILSVTITPEKIHESAKAWSAVIVGCLFTRLTVVLAVPLLHWTNTQACIVGALVFSAACFVIVWARREKMLAIAGWGLLALGAFVYAADTIVTMPLELDVWLITGILFCTVLGGRATAAVSKSRDELAVFLAFAGWLVFSRWAWVVLQVTIPSMNSLPAVSIAWIAYFLGLIALGFTYRLVQFRYVSFVVLGTTLVKILMIDLASTDALIRVAVTIITGLVMLAVASHWYVKAKDPALNGPGAKQA